MTKAAIYVRISADREGKALGVGRQEADCRALAERLGWAAVEVYSDNDVSAFSRKPRPQYRRMLDDIRAGAVTAVLAYAPDRLYRRLADLAEFIDTVTAARCSVQTVAAGEIDLSTASGRQTAKLLGVIAEGESDRTGERIKRKLDERRAAGKPHGGLRPFGWEPDRMTVREDEAQWIRRSAEQLLSGVPVRGVFRDLNARGSRNTRRGQWTHPTFRTMIMNARHAGLMRDGSPASWPAIITPEAHRALLRLLNDPSRVTTPGRAGKLHLLSTIARCGICGGPVRASKGKSGDPVYRCYPSGEIQRARLPIDELVRTVIARRLRQPDARRLLAAAEDDEAHEARLAAEARAETLRQRIDEAATDGAQLGLSVREIASFSAPLRAELAEAEAAATPPPDRNGLLGELLAADDPGAAFLAADIERQRAVIDLLVTVTIGRGRRGPGFDPKGIEIDWR